MNRVPLQLPNFLYFIHFWSACEEQRITCELCPPLWFLGTEPGRSGLVARCPLDEPSGWPRLKLPTGSTSVPLQFQILQPSIFHGIWDHVTHSRLPIPSLLSFCLLLSLLIGLSGVRVLMLTGPTEVVESNSLIKLRKGLVQSHKANSCENEGLLILNLFYLVLQ